MPPETLQNNNDRIILKHFPSVVLVLVLLLTGPSLTYVKGEILDPADVVITEVEFDDPDQSQNINEYFAENEVVGIEGNLINSGDVDSYRFFLGRDWTMGMQFEIQATEDKAITAITTDVDGKVYFVSENGIWRYDLEDNDLAELLIPSAYIAEFLNLDPEVPVQINAIAGVPDPDAEAIVVIALGGDASAGGGNILGLDQRDDDLIVITTREDIETLTGEPEVEITAVAADDQGRIYLADQAGGSVLLIERPLSSYAISIYTSDEVLMDAIRIAGFEGLELGSMIPVVITDAENETQAFVVNSMIKGSGEYTEIGFDWFFLSQLGPAFGGTGRIIKVMFNHYDPGDIQYDYFFNPGAEELDLNPSALALDTSNDAAFGNLLYMGTFGPSLGDDFDGEIYSVSRGGVITPFVTSYEDNGQPATRGGQEVTGFFDVVDIAFPPTFDGPFGEYLYVLSENIDQNGTEPGGFSSDIWRIDADGVAELFIENITDAVISLAFGNAEYGNDLFVATFQEGKVLRVDSAGNVEVFFDDFSFLGTSISVCDMAFAPSEVPGSSSLANTLVLTVKSGADTYAIQLEPDGQDYEVLATDLQTGDVSSGDIVFDETGNLFIAQQAAKNIVRLDYLGQLDYSFEQLQVRPMTEQGGEESFIPYVLATVVDQPAILRLSDSGDPTDIAIEVDSSVLDIGVVPNDGSKEISFVFDANGDLFTYIQNVDELRTSQRNEEGEFTQFTSLLTGSEIDTSTSLANARLPQLAWSQNGRLLATGTNGTADDPNQAFDDIIMQLGNTIDQEYEPTSLVELRNLTQMRLEVTGPENESHEFTADPGDILDETLNALTEGNYTLSVSSTKSGGGNYQILMTLDNTVPGQWVCDDSTGPRALLNRVGESLIFDHRGPGQSLLEFEYDPNGWLMEIPRLTVTGSKRSTSVFLTNQETPDNMLLEELILNGSLGQLTYTGTLNVLRGAESTKGTIKYVEIGTVRDVDAEGYTFPEFRATNLGDSETQDHQFLAKKITRLIVENNVENINVMEFDSRNAYRQIDIGGIVDTCVLSGAKISECIVRNLRNEELAMRESYLYCPQRGGSIGQVQIEQGDLYRTGIFSDKYIKKVELVNGNLDTCTVETLGEKSIVGEVIVRRVDELTDPNESGNIFGSRIVADREIKRVHADEEINEGTEISTNTSARTRINTVTCEGNCAASISSYQIKDILVGFDENKKKILETSVFTGANFKGSVSATSKLDTLSVTGSIENASIYGYKIDSIFAEDGLTDTGMSFGRKLTRVMVGYENGRRKHIANDNADVSGTISGYSLGRLYYTGENTIDLSSDEKTVRHVGPVIDDVP